MSIDRRRVRYGDAEIATVGEMVPVIFFDQLTEFRTVQGLVYLTLASASRDGDGELVFDLQARLRMSLVQAQLLRDTLANLIETAQKPADLSKAN